MNGQVGQIFVKLGATTSEFDSKMSAAAARMKNIGQKMSQIGNQMTMKVTLPLLAVAGATIKAASDAEEMRSKFDAVFKDMSKQVEGWSKDTAASMGRSRYEMQGYLATLQDTFVPLGFAREAAAALSKQVVTLAYDLGSFNNVPVAEVVRDLQSALVGNVETMRKYGVVANETAIKQEHLALTGETVKGVLNAQDKAAAILSITMKGTKDAQGDLARTSGSFANKVKALNDKIYDLRVQIGEKLLPVASDLVDVLAEFADKLADMPADKIELLIKLFAGMLIAGPAVKILRGIATAIGLIGGAATAAVAALALLGIAVKKSYDQTLPPWLERLLQFVPGFTVAKGAGKLFGPGQTPLPTGTMASHSSNYGGGGTATAGGTTTGGGGGGAAAVAARASQALSGLSSIGGQFGAADFQSSPMLAPFMSGELTMRLREAGEVGSEAFDRIGEGVTRASVKMMELGKTIQEGVGAGIYTLVNSMGAVASQAAMTAKSLGDAFQMMAAGVVSSVGRAITAIGAAIASSMAASAAMDVMAGRYIKAIRTTAAAIGIATAFALIGGGLQRLGESQAPGMALGGTVMQSGLAMVHRGETYSGVPGASRQESMQPTLKISMGELWVEMDRYGRENGLTMGRS